MTDKVQKIREEVERLKSQLLRGACSSQIVMETSCKEEAYNEVLVILDTMQKEPVSEELEAAAIEICSKVLKGETIIIDGYEYVVLSDAEECFKAGAKWQKQQIEIDYIVLSPVEYQKTIERYFKDGMNEQKKQIKENIQSWLDGV